MTESMSTQERQLCEFLQRLPESQNYRYTSAAYNTLLENLFLFLCGGRQDYVPLLFPRGIPYRRDDDERPIRLSEQQGAVDGAEYTEAARGRPCGHIFKPGEASYSCKTCSDDDTCCLCMRCFDSTDHTGHIVRVSISPGNSGCCDCGDMEAWRLPVFCTIHSHWEHNEDKGKYKEQKPVPDDLLRNIHMTIGRVLDYLCDVISCSPEQLRLEKTVESIMHDEKMSRLGSTYHGGDLHPAQEFCICLWNDEKHTATEVRDQVARACHTTLAEGMQRAYETDMTGRAILMYDRSIEKLLKVAGVLEQIRVTITIRSSRDTFREQMCGTIIEWLSDIAGCTVGSDHNVLRNAVCEEFLKPWQVGSSAAHAEPGKEGIDDEDFIEQRDDGELAAMTLQGRLLAQTRAAVMTALAAEDAQGDSDDGETDDGTVGEEVDLIQDDDDDEDVMMIDAVVEHLVSAVPPNPDQALEEDEATIAGYPPPPPPPPPARREHHRGDQTPSDSDTAEPLIPPAIYAKSNLEVPKTPGVKQDEKITPQKPVKYWLAAPTGYLEQEYGPTAENLFQRLRLDWTVLFDLRMWKKLRIDLRSLYITTVVTVPEFKRILGLRFAGLFPTLAQLYLIADREPDHSIINLSLQMLTTRSITAEVVERGNFLTSLMAILYTFLTTRQVGHPWNVSPAAVLAFDTGSVTNRRMYHFFQDLKYLFNSPHVQERLRIEDRYMMQFLDLVKLHQGICPNVRAIGDHVEYEADTWINASLITREINKLCRLFAQSFAATTEQDLPYVAQAINLAAKQVITNSIGAERLRFAQAEIKDEVCFRQLDDFEFDEPNVKYNVIKFVVDEQPISFHHALHYTLSWLIECGKSMTIEQMRASLSFTAAQLRSKPLSMGRKTWPRQEHSPEDYLMAVFDYPLRVCAWLAQMKTQMWVRNGISLRHQAASYRGIIQRDASHHRDIFMLQAALVICNPSRVLVSIIDRFGMEMWVKGFFELKTKAQDDAQHLDVVEDMVHLLIVLLSDRNSLLEANDEPNAGILALKRDLIHVLCFKPLAYTEICSKLPEEDHKQESFPTVLEQLTNYKSPEGTSDTGTFELKPEFLGEVEPFIAHYNKNQREEAETAWRKHTAAQTVIPLDDVVYEPKLRPIRVGIFSNLAGFTGTGMFAQLIYYCLLYPLVSEKYTPKVTSTRIETYLQLVLHLILIAIQADEVPENEAARSSFIQMALTRQARSSLMPEAPDAKSIVSMLELLSNKGDYKACHPRISLILKRMRQRRPRDFDSAFHRLGIPVDRVSTASPANNMSAEEERDRKKKAALERQARVMAQFQNQQKSFLANQGSIDWGNVDEMSEEEPAEPMEETKKMWKYPGETCIYCQEDLNEKRLFGTFAYIRESRILRQTYLLDADYIREALDTPKDLDRSCENSRPFGVAGQNRKMIAKINSQGESFLTERQILGKGFPEVAVRVGPVSVGCGHIMHYSCFESHNEAIHVRHRQQIARHHPEDHDRNEFVCPLCKALGNAFLPIIWSGREESYPGALTSSANSFHDFMEAATSKSRTISLGGKKSADRALNGFKAYTVGQLTGDLSNASSQLITEAWSTRSSNGPSPSLFGSDSPPASNSADRLSPSEDGEATPSMKELVQIYRRLRDTLRDNELTSTQPVQLRRLTHDNHAQDLSGSYALVRAVGYSISALEIQYRGTDAEYGSLLLEKMSEQSLTHLRILAETASSYIAVGCQKEGGMNATNEEFGKECERQHCQLFIGRYLSKEVESARHLVKAYLPLLQLDCFIFLCDCIYGIGTADNFDIAHLLRICYLAEITKAVYHIQHCQDSFRRIQIIGSGLDSPNISTRLFAWFCREIDNDSDHDSRPFDMGSAFIEAGVDDLESVRSLVRSYAQTFLRKCVVLLYVKYGVDFNSHISPEPERDELDRLTEALRLPSFDEMCGALATNSSDQTTQSIWPSSTASLLVHGWISHQTLFKKGPPNFDLLEGQVPSDYRPPDSCMLSHPGIYELIGLPKNYDLLIGECMKMECPTTGKDLTDPMLCLVCGAVMCGQGICCQAEDPTRKRGGTVTRIGGAQQHMRKCQKNTGLFLDIRKCATFFLHRHSGSFGQAPYIDKYGETDMGLRHSRQLFLSQKRYDSMLRTLWLSHGVPSYICRKLEAEINSGGWETI